MANAGAPYQLAHLVDRLSFLQLLALGALLVCLVALLLELLYARLKLLLGRLELRDLGLERGRLALVEV